MPVVRVTSLLAVLLLPQVSCSFVLQFDPELLLENNAARCSDGVDNDDNGLTDCAEPDCAIFDFCREASEEACRDRVDNDRNGLIDCEDPGCLGYPQCTEQLDGQCADHLDNNGDGLVDCQDFTCAAEPSCCTLMATLLEAPLTAPAGACVPGVCQVGQSGAGCPAFDPTRWVSVGDPAPAVAAAGAGLDPNRCDACYLAGDCAPCADAVLLSQRAYTYRAGLQAGAQLHLGTGPYDRAGVALTWQTSFEEGTPCTGDTPVDRVAAVELTADASGGAVVTFLVDGAVEATRPWPGDSVAAFVRVDPEGFALFSLRSGLADLPAGADVPAHRSDRPLPVSAAPLRLALYGGGAGLRVSAAGVWDAARCQDPVPSRTDRFSAGVALPAGDPGSWDRDMVEGPTVVRFGGQDHLYYAGRDDAQGGLGAIGHAVLDADATSMVWTRDPASSPVLRAEDLYAWPPGQAELYGPAAVVLPDGRLALYFTVARRDGERIVWTGVDGAVSDDGVHFERLLAPQERPVLLPAVDEALYPESWEIAVRDPAVVWQVQGGEVRFTMLYVGRSDPENPFTSQLGLATSTDGVDWQRDNLWGAGCAPGLCNLPVLAPPSDALVHTAVSDPTLVWDPALEVFRLWYVWRVGQAFSIFHAVSTSDARSWVSYPGNPVLRSGDAAWCDDLYLDGPSATLDAEGHLRLWYHGHSLTYGHSICYAENAIEE